MYNFFMILFTQLNVKKSVQTMQHGVTNSTARRRFGQLAQDVWHFFALIISILIKAVALIMFTVNFMSQISLLYPNYPKIQIQFKLVVT